MNRRAWRACVALAAWLLIAAAPALAHEGGAGTTIQVEPSSVVAGDTVVLAGSGLEADSERVLVLAGADMIISMGSVTTDAEGMFQIELTIPAHLPSGAYELQAIGDETLTTPLAVTAATGPGASPGPDDLSELIVARDRSPIEIGLLLALILASLAVGGLLAWRAEHFRGAPRD